MSLKRSNRRTSIMLILLAWLLVGWPPVWHFPPKSPKAKAYSQMFTASGSWQAPAGVTSVTVEAWGGGGAGGGRGAVNGVSGGGGGGAYAAKTITVTPGNSYNYTIGAGGTGASGNGPAGGDTTWDAGADVKAAGGSGGLGTTTKGLGGTTAASVGTTLFKGGDGADGATTLGGGGGSGAGYTAAGNNASGQTAGTFQNEGGAGGNGGSNSNGVAAVVFGGGGGGAARTSGTRTGGNGAAGAVRVTYSTTSTLSMQTGYYIGDGTSSKSITGLGFAPDYVMVKSDTTAGAAVFKTRVMPDANLAFVTATADNTASNLTLDNDGFSLGSLANVNSVGVRYTWIAFAGSNCTSSGIFCVGQYTGNGGTTRAIGTGFQPNLVIVKRTTAVAAHIHTASEPNDESLYLTNTVRDTTGNFIKSFTSSAFNVGTTDNAATGVYNYIAFKSSANIFAEGTYTGDDADDKAITSVGFRPDAVMVKNSTNATANNDRPVLNTRDTYGDYAGILTAAANATNGIQALLSNGFEIGNGALTNTSPDVYYWMAWAGAPSPTSSGGFKMANGTYTGNGTSQSVSGLGFTPNLVIIKDNAANYQVFRTSLMTGDTTAYLSNAAANFTTGITSLDGDGFSIGASTVINTSTNTYHWQAFGNAWDPETKTGSNDFAIGAYMGNAEEDRNIPGLPWQPDFVAIKRSGASAGVWRSSALSGDLSSFFGATAEAANYAQALNSDGFQIGTNAAVNTAAALNYWFAFKSGGGFTTGTYTGNAVDNRDITGIGFQPELVWVKRSTAVNGVSRPASLTGDNTQYFANTANVSNRIQDLIYGGFEIGGNQTETNTSAAIYRYAVWRNAPEVSVVITSDGTVSYGTLGADEQKSTLDLSDTQTAINDGTLPADFNIRTDAPAGWTLSSTPGPDTFVHEFSTTSGSSWTLFGVPNVYQSLTTNIAPAASKNFDLRITAPDFSTNSSQKGINVTIQSVEH